MRKNLRSKILLCILAGGVLAANTALAAEYNSAIMGAEDADRTFDSIKTNTGNNYTYTFTEDSVLKIDGNKYGIAIGDYLIQNEVHTDSITVVGENLNIDITNEQIEEQSVPAYGFGISVGPGKDNKTIDMSENNGYIKVYTKTSTSTGGATSYGAVLFDSGSNTNNKLYIGNAIMDLSAYSSNSASSFVAGLYITNGNEHIITMRDGQITGKAVSEKGSAEAFGIYDGGFDNTIEIGNVPIDVMAEGNADSYITASGIEKWNSGSIEVGNGDITSKVINNGSESNSQSLAYGINNNDGGTVTKGNGKITVVAEGGLKARAYGVYANNSTINLGIADINTKTIGGSTENNYFVDSIGIWVENSSAANIEGGSITAQSYNNDGISEKEDAFVRAILSVGTSEVNINQRTNNDVVINGDVETRSNAVVNLNLNTANSELNGAVYDNGNNGTTLNLANGAEWNNTGASNLNTLSMDSGVINQNIIEAITVKNYSGNGEIILSVGDDTTNGDIDVDAGRTNITSAAENSVINMSVSNNNRIGTTDYTQTLENLNKIAENIKYDDNDGNITGKVTIKEGLIMPEVSGDLLFDSNDIGYVANISSKKTSATMDSMQHLAETAIVAWRQEDSTLSQRLGELRNSDGGQGVWVRMSRGEFEYDGAYKNQYNFFQMGYDWASGDWHYGAAVSHNDGQTTYAQGDGENRSTSLSLYGTWLGDKGHYADIVLKQGRLSNDFDIYTEAGHTSGDYDAWGTSLSGEYGMKVALNDGWYVTPQAQLTLMRIGSEDYTTNNGIKVHQDSLESAVGRIGFELGKDISESGSIYAKASLLHDFAGSADTYLSQKDLTNSYRQDIGDTWCEAGIGFNYKTSANSYVYADIVKTFGGDVDTPWQWNAGMRWTF